MPPKVLIPVLFEGGLDTKTEGRLVIAGKALVAENIVRNRAGSWEERNGVSALPAIGITTTGKKVFARESEVCALVDGFLYAFDAQKNAWVLRNTTSLLERMSAPTHKVNYVYAKANDNGEDVAGSLFDSLNQPTVAYGNGYLCYAFQDGDSAVLNYIVINQTTGQVVLSEQTTGAGSMTKVVHSEGFFGIFYATEAGASPSVISVIRISSTTLAVTSAVTVAGDGLASATGKPWLDVLVRADNSNVLVLYRSNTPSVKILEWDLPTNTASIAAVTPYATDDASAALGILDGNFTDDGGQVLIAVCTTGGLLKTGKLNGTTLALNTTQTIEAAVTGGTVSNITGYVTGTNHYVYYEVRATTLTQSLVKQGIWTGSAALSTVMRSCGLASKVFNTGTVPSDDKWRVLLTYAGAGQQTYFLCHVRNALSPNQGVGSVEARILRWKGGGLTNPKNMLSGVAKIATSKYQLPVRRLVDVALSPTGNTEYKFAIAGVFVDYTTLGNVTKFGRSAVIPGGNPIAYDGLYTTEMGFHLDPEQPTLAQSAGGSLSVGTYKYKIVYTWLDIEGRLWRGGPSLEASITTTTGNGTVTVTCPTLRVTAKTAASQLIVRTQIEVYRTKVGGGTFFRAGVVVNDRTVDSVSFVDTMGDTTLSSNILLYTDGGVFTAHPPPPIRAAVVSEDRMLAIDSESPRTIWASMPIINGGGVFFHPDLSITVDADGDFTAIAVMDGRVLAFKESAIYIFPNTWPDNLGRGASPPIAQRISTVYGTMDPESILVTHEGIWFRDPKKGMCLLNRGIEVVPQHEIFDFNTGSVLAAAIIPDLFQARFNLGSGKVLVWDHAIEQWYTFTGWNAVHAAVVGGVYYYIESDATVVKEDRTLYTDKGVSFTAKLGTGWLQVPWPQTEQWVYEAQFTGNYFGNPVTLTVDCFLNHKEVVAQTKSYAIATIAVSSRFEAGFTLAEPRNKAIRFNLSWPVASQRIALTGVSLNVAQKVRLRHLPQGNM